MKEKPWRRHPSGGRTLEEESCRRHVGGNWATSVSMHGESQRENHGGGLMGKESWRRNREGTVEQESMGRNYGG